MTALIVFSLVWVVAVVLVLVLALGATAWNLRRARHNLHGIADDLERIGQQAQPLEAKLTSVGSEVEAIVGALGRVDGALGAVLDVVAGLLAPNRS